MKNLSLFVLLFLLAGVIQLPYHGRFRPGQLKPRHRQHRHSKSHDMIEKQKVIIEEQAKTIQILNSVITEKLSQPRTPTQLENRRAYRRGLRLLNSESSREYRRRFESVR